MPAKKERSERFPFAADDPPTVMSLKEREAFLLGNAGRCIWKPEVIDRAHLIPARQEEAPMHTPIHDREMPQ